MFNKKIYTLIRTKILFSVFRNLMKSYTDGHQDKEYWREKGLLQGKKLGKSISGILFIGKYHFKVVAK